MMVMMTVVVMMVMVMGVISLCLRGVSHILLHRF